MSFLTTPSIIFGVYIRDKKGKQPKNRSLHSDRDDYDGVTSTTVSSDVVMTKQAEGNDSLTLIEVTIENLLGTFISPALAQLVLSDPANGQSVTQL